MATRNRKRGERGPVASIGLHTALVLLTLFSILPIVWLILTSFKPNSEILSASINLWPKSPTTENYRRLLSDTDFPTWFLNSIIVAALTMTFGILISATAGYAVSRFRFPGYRPLMWTFLIVQMFPISILIVSIYTIMSTLGLLDTYASLVIAYLATVVPFTAWMLKGYFDSIPIDIDEAGRVDGLNPFGTFWRLILPLARPGIAVTAFYTFLTAWGEVAYAQTFMLSANKYTLAVGIQTFVGQFLTEWGLLTAAGVIIMVPAMLVFFIAQKHLVAGLTAGGTKG